MFTNRSAIETRRLAGILKLILKLKEKKLWSVKDFIPQPSDTSHVATVVLSIPYGIFTIFWLIQAIPCSVATVLKGTKLPQPELPRPKISNIVSTFYKFGFSYSPALPMLRYFSVKLSIFLVASGLFVA